MDEPLTAVGCLGRQAIGRKCIDKCGGHLDGVDHAPLRVARVRIEAGKCQRHRVGGKAFPLEVAAAAAVHGVGALRAERRDVEVLRAASHLFIGRECHADDTVRNLGMREQVLHRRHDFRDAGFVVCAQQRRARGGHDVVADALGKRLVLGAPQHRGRIVGQDDVVAVVASMDERLHPGAAHLGGRIHVGNEANRRNVRLQGGGGHRGRHVSVRVHADIGGAERLELAGQVPQQHQLRRRARIGVGRLVRLCVVTNVAEKPFEDCAHVPTLRWRRVPERAVALQLKRHIACCRQSRPPPSTRASVQLLGRSMPMRRIIATGILLLFGLVAESAAAVLPPGFLESLVASGISSPTAMAFARS